jgi:lysylphosphatidylglycerol synthetase-like protein (DUF2156 family)
MPRATRIRFTRGWALPAILAAVVVVVVTAGAAAAIETDTVSSFWKGLWWSISLLTTVGFVGQPPRTTAGAWLSVVVMVVGFLLLAMVSASLAALFVSEEERPRGEREEAAEDQILAALLRLDARLDAIEARLDEQKPPGD